MTGVGLAHGAISILNAIPCGIGSSMAVNMHTKAVFKAGGDGDAADPLVDECVLKTLESIGEAVDGFSVKIETDIPMKRGLKSSSSVANAVIDAVLNEYGYDMDDVLKYKINALCGIKTKVSITGAFDDACATGGPGLYITDNPKMTIIGSKRMSESFDVLVTVPEMCIDKQDIDVTKYLELADRYRKLSHMISGDPFMVMTENGRYVAGLSGQSESIIDMALDNGALGAGVTGTGPAVAIVCYRENTADIECRLDCEYIRTKTIQ